MATQCLFKVSGLEGARRQRSTSSSRLEVVRSREQFEDWSGLVRHDARFLSTVKGLPWDAPNFVGESTQMHWHARHH